MLTCGAVSTKDHTDAKASRAALRPPRQLWRSHLVCSSIASRCVESCHIGKCAACCLAILRSAIGSDIMHHAQ